MVGGKHVCPSSSWYLPAIGMHPSPSILWFILMQNILQWEFTETGVATPWVTLTEYYFQCGYIDSTYLPPTHTHTHSHTGIGGSHSI